MTARAIGVRHDKKVSAVHALRELDAELMHTLNMRRIVHVELFRRKVLCVRVHLISPTERSRHLLCSLNDRLRRLHRAREASSTRRAVLQVLRTTRTYAQERVLDRRSCARRRLNVDGAHRLTSSPSCVRTSTTAASTARRMSSSTAVPARTTWFKFTPTRRSCSTALASSGDGLGIVA